MESNLVSEPDIRLQGTILNISSREQLALTVNTLKKKQRIDVEDFFEDYYENGYSSEKIFLSPDNHDLLAKIKNKKKNQKNYQKLTIDSLNIIDPIFGAFINDDGEIIVNDSLFKFTPRGLYFGKIEDSLKIRQIALNKNNTSFSQRTSSDPCSIRLSEGGITRIDDDVHQFVREADETGCFSSGGGSGTVGLITGVTNNGGYKANTDIYNAKNSDTGLNLLIQDLRIETDPAKNAFQSIWGTYRFAHEYFSNDDYRFEIDFWDQEWLIYRSVGIEAETHKDGWFWWNNIKSNEIVLGINKVHLVYDIPAPDISFFANYTNNYLNQNTKQPLYLHDKSFFIKNNNSTFQPISIKVLNNSRIPFFEFRDEAILNIYVGSVLGININQDISYNIFNDSNIKALYKLGADFLKSRLSKRKDFIVTIQRNSKEVDLLYFDEYQRVYNTDEVKKIFFSEWEWQVGLKFVDSGTGWNSKFTLINLDGFNTLGNYRSKSIDIYGLARRGEEWRGLRLKF